MGSHRTPSENRHARALRVGEVHGYSRPVHQGPVGNIAEPSVSHQRFTGNPSRLVSGAPWWDTSSALAQPCAAADAVDRRRLSKPSCPARLILFRWARMMAAIPSRAETFRWQHKTFDITSLLQDLRSGAVCPEKLELQPAFIEGYCSHFLDRAGSSARPPLATNGEYADALLPEHLAKPIVLLHVGDDEGLVSLREDHPEPHYVVADGNHRLLAARRLKMKVEAYVLSREQSNRYEQTPDA